LSTIADDENYLQKIKKKSIQSENTQQQQTDLFNQIPIFPYIFSFLEYLQKTTITTNVL
jgi:hypothetical protein